MAITVGLVNRSVTLTGSAQNGVLGQNVGRQLLIIENPSASHDVWISFDSVVPAANGSGSIRLAPNGGSYTFDGAGVVPTNALNVIGTLNDFVTIYEA